jgi:tetratricopeptide (TPR) repeat protein
MPNFSPAAISEFQIASRAASRAVDARYVIGLVKMDQGKHEEAVKAFDDALAVPTATRDQRGAAEYSKGASLEELGRFADALRSFKAAKQNGNGAIDIDRRIKALSERVPPDAAMPGRGPKNIDYL